MPPNPFSRDPAVTVGVNADAEQFNEGIEQATDRLGGLRKAAGLAGAAIGALGAGAMAKSVQAAADFESAMVEVEKVTSPETARKMGDRIKEMAEEIPLAQSRLAGLAADAGRFGIEGPKAIENFTETAAKMAEATNLSANKAGESLAKLSELTNTPISQMENLGSSVNTLSNNFATSSQEIVDSMLRASGSLSQLGLNQREIAGLTASLNEVSESSERAGTRLRRVGQELLDPKKAGEMAEALGMTSEEFRTMREESPVKLIQQMATVMAEGGDQANMLRETLSTTSRQALSGLSQNLNGVREAQTLANRSFEEGTSLQEEFNAATDTFNARLRIFRNRLRNIGIQVGNQLLPPLTDLLDTITPLIDDFSEMNKQSDGLIASLGLAGSAVGGLALAAGAFVSGPAGLLVAAIGGITSAAVLLRDEFEIVDDVLTTAGDVASDAFSTAERTARDALGTIETAVSDALDTAESLWNTHKSDIKRTARTAYNQASNAIDTATGTIQTVVSGALTKAESLWNTHKSDIKRTARTAYNQASDAVDSATSTIETEVGKALSAAEKAWNDHGDEVKKIASDAFGFVTDEASKVLKKGGQPVIFGPLGLAKSAVQNNFGKMKSTVSTATDEMSKNLKMLGDTIGTQLIDPLSNSESTTRNTLSSMTKEVRESFNIVQTIINDTIGVALPEIEELITSLSETWRRNLGGKNGIVANGRDAFNALWNNIIRPVVNQIQSAWDVFGDDLLKVAEGVFGAIETAVSIAMNGVLGSINVVLDLLSGDFTGAFTNAKKTATNAISEIADFFKTDGVSLIQGAIGLLVDAITQPFKEVYNFIIGDSIMKDLIKDIKSYFIDTGKGLLKDGVSALVEPFKNGFSYVTGSGKGTLKWDVLSGLNFLTGTGKGTLAGIITNSLSSSLSGIMQPVKKAFSYLTGTGEGTLIGDIKGGVNYITGTGDGTFIGDIKDTIGDINTYLIGTGGELLDRAIGGVASTIKSGLSYVTGTGEDTLIGDIKSALSNAGKEIGKGVKTAINDALGLPFEHTIGRVEVAGEEVFSGQTIKIPALAEGGVIEESGLAFVDEGERFSGAPGVPGAEVDQSGGMMLSESDLRDAVADGVKRAAGAGALGNEDVARAIEEQEPPTIEFRDEDRYRAVRR